MPPARPRRNVTRYSGPPPAVDSRTVPRRAAAGVGSVGPHACAVAPGNRYAYSGTSVVESLA